MKNTYTEGLGAWRQPSVPTRNTLYKKINFIKIFRQVCSYMHAMQCQLCQAKIFTYLHAMQRFALQIWAVTGVIRDNPRIQLKLSPCSKQNTGYPETTNATDNNKRNWNQQAGKGVNTCLGKTCRGSNWSVASCSQTGIFYSLWLLIDFSSVCCSLSHWLSMGNRCEHGLMKNAIRSLVKRQSGREIMGLSPARNKTLS